MSTDLRPDGSPAAAGTQLVCGKTRRGRPCELVNNTGDALPHAELLDILQRLVDQDVFGFHARSESGGSALSIDAPQTAHVQIGEKLYRLIVDRYQARLEAF